jgi:hypothetical protein
MFVAAVTGERGRRGGVPNLGGVWPNEAERAAAKAETPGPGKEEWGAAPARGVRLPFCCSGCPGVGIWRICGVPSVLWDGTGEDNRAVEVALGTGLPDNRPLCDPGEDAIGTGRGREEGDPTSLGVDIVPLFSNYLEELS